MGRYDFHLRSKVSYTNTRYIFSKGILNKFKHIMRPKVD